MKRLLRNLVCSLTGSASARNSTRRSTTRLQIEGLEDRLVPTTVNLSNNLFELQGPKNQVGTLYITTENAQGQFTGYFEEVQGSAEVMIPVTGSVGPTRPGKPANVMNLSFQGSVKNGATTDGVSFTGVLTQPGQVEGGVLGGMLDETFSTTDFLHGVHRSSTDVYVTSMIQPQNT